MVRAMEHIKIVTMAPELEGATEAIEGLCEQGIVVSAGYSTTAVDQALGDVEAGVTMVTHMFNAMYSFHHRDPGIVGLLGKSIDNPFYGLIVDGIHCDSIPIAP